jgi:iron complex transport system substrate-binding protein
MSTPSHRLGWAVILVLLSLAASAVWAADPSREDRAERVVSLNPSLTEMLLALDAVESLVGVDAYSAQLQPEVRDLPRVGGLFNPSLEAVVSLQPDLVVMVPGARQRDLAERLDALGVRVLELPNISLDQVLGSLDALGRHVGRRAEAAAQIETIRSAWREIEQQVSGRPRVRAVLVLQRDPLYLVGRGSFIDDMLRVAGGENAAAVFDEPYPRVAMEWLIDAAPEVILDATEDAGDAALHWSRWPSLPAVSSGRAVSIPPAVMRPGPHLDRSLRILAAALNDRGRSPAEGESP